MILVVVDEINERISYTFDFIFKSRGIEFALTTNESKEEKAAHSVLVYSEKETGKNTILAAPIMTSKKIENHQISKSNFQNEECLAFDEVTDPIASIFYLLSRYEEYVCLNKDEHNRFPFIESLLNKFNWIEKAMCDRLAKEILLFIGVDVQPPKNIEIIPTFDIDNTFAYQLKSGKQKIMSVCKDLFQLNFSRLKERKSVLNGELKDPYDTFDKIKGIAQRFPATKVFWLVGELAEKDRNISIFNVEHQDLIREINATSSVNLHPSYASFLSLERLQKEKQNLEETIHRKITASRQHFLRFQLPDSFRLLEKVGFRDEYSMGFAEKIGFRSSTAHEHLWFDLEQNRISNLTIHPFVYMDGTLNEYMQLSIDESKIRIKELYNEVLQFGGDFVFLWHNETIGDYQKWEEWSSVLEFTLNLGDE